MVKHTQTIRRQIPDELFESVGLALKQLINGNTNLFAKASKH